MVAWTLFDGETGWGVKRLNGMDAMLLYSETPNLHTHTLKVAVIDATDFDGEYTFEVFRRTVQRRLHLLDHRLEKAPIGCHGSSLGMSNSRVVSTSWLVAPRQSPVMPP